MKACAVVVAVGLLCVGAGAAGTGSRANDEREVWIAAQDSSAVTIMFSRGGMDRISLPAEQKPHTIEFSPSGRYAYLADVGSGHVVVVRTTDRAVVADLTFGSTRSHQAKPSPNGLTVLVAVQAPSRELVKLVADEARERWSVSQARLTVPGIPDCTVYRNDGRKAYVSLKPSGIVVVDVATMTLERVLETEGEVACSLQKSRDGRTVFVGSNGGSGHVYVLDTRTDTLRELAFDLRATELHGLTLTTDSTTIFASSRGSDEIKVIDVRSGAVETVSVDATPGVADRPDMLVVRGGVVYVPLRATGKVARVSVARPRTVDYLEVAPPSSNAVHGMGVRPDVTPPRVRITLPRQSFSRALAKGLRIRISCNESCDVRLRAVARASRTTVRKNVSVVLARAGARTVVVRLPARTRPAFLLAGRVRLTLSGRVLDGVANEARVRTTLALRR
ncbi:MAG: hypothetical protein WD689_08280 [Gaiellaceae bacterium]